VGIIAPQVDLGKFSNEDLGPLERLVKCSDIAPVLQQEQERVKAVGNYSNIDDFSKAWDMQAV
jgi:hypothetical protein